MRTYGAIRWWILTASLLVLAFSSSLVTASSLTDPIFSPELALRSASAEIKVDGRINDSGWQQASVIDRFVEIRPGNNTAPEVETKVWATFDNHNIYVAFLCKDDPSAVRSTLCQRDQPSGDDMVMIALDTYGNGTWAYELMVNPHGVQRDQLWSISSQTDIGFDLVWQSAAMRTDSGYQVEIAIPFASLRFPDADQQSWKIDFRRVRPRETTKQYAWSAVDRNQQCYPCQFGTVSGIEHVSSGRGIELLPAFVGYRTGERESLSSFRDHDAKGEMSLSGKFTTTSDITIEAAVNPDFSQIESDAGQIDVNSTVALLYPERRPFFNEGSDIFQTLFNSFYTRTVADPSFAAKITGRLPKTRFGLLSAVDENSPYLIPVGEFSLPTLNSGRSYVNVLRGTQTLGNGSQVGVMLTDRRFRHDGSGNILSGDYVLRLAQKYVIDGQYLLSHTAEMNEPSLTERFNGITFDHDKYTVDFDGESYWGTAFIQRIGRYSEHWNLTFDYNQVSPSYRTHTGYDPVNDHRSASSYGSVTARPKGGMFETIQPGFFVFRRWNFDGGRLQETNALNLFMGFRFAQSSVFMAYRDIFESFAGYDIDGLHALVGQFSIRPHKRIAADLSINAGTAVTHFLAVPEKADELIAEVGLSLKPIDRLTIESGTSYYAISDRAEDTAYFDGYITRTRFQYQIAKELSIRLVAQYNDFSKVWSVDPLFTYRLSPFSVFYAGSTMDYADWSDNPNDPNAKYEWKLAQRQFFMKLQYLFQI